jgi:hypothetical protein
VAQVRLWAEVNLRAAASLSGAENEWEYYNTNQGLTPIYPAWTMAIQTKDGKLFTQEFNHIRHEGGTTTYSYVEEPRGYTLQNIADQLNREWWRRYDSMEWQTILHGPNHDDHIIRSEN